MKVTFVLIIINVIVYLALEILGDTESAKYMMDVGAIYPPYIVEKGQYWRLFTATFMHFGLPHLMNNMVILGSAGQILENALGKWKFLVLYLCAGIGGSAMSCGQMLASGDYGVAAGASGAVFGIIGALVWIVIVHKGRYESLTGKGLTIMIVLCLYYGVTAGNVDNWGHIGGLIMGFLICIIFYRRNIKKIDFTEQNLYTYTYDNNTCEVEDEN
ncbi:MAG: rhomboid family intramembrane serine protease [Lachnospiraceae bacterium]|nr:rhomboid family intramembrane serine protease [Lachnospiraceae bacterium]